MLNMPHQATNELLSYNERDFRTPTSGKGSCLSCKLLNLKALWSAVSIFVFQLLKTKALDFRYEYDDCLPTHVLSDEFRA